MKKTILYLFSIFMISAGFLACEDPYANQIVADPTIYEQPAIQDASFVASVKTNPLTITADKLTSQLNLISMTTVPSLVDSLANVTYQIILSNTADFAVKKMVTTTVQGKDLYVSYKQLNDTLKALNPTLAKHTVYARVLSYIVKEGTKALVTSANLPFDVTTYNFPPVAVNDTVTAFKDQVLSYNVLKNDTDFEGDQITLVSATGASHGTVTVSNGFVFYTPTAGYVGKDVVTYTISDGNSTATASVVITVTAMKQYFETTVKPWYIVGLGGKWNNSVDGLGSDLIPLSVVTGYMYNEAGDGEFVYTGWISGSTNFKLIHTPGDWNTQWGNKGGEGINSPVMNDGGSSNLKVPADGYYKISLNSINNTLTIVATSAPSNTFTQLGLIGGFNGWSGDDLMTSNSNSNGHFWYKTITFTTDGNFLFRANADWNKKIGAPSSAGNGDPVYQKVGLGLLGGGADILQKTGTFVIMMNDIDGCYYAVQK